MWFYNGEAAPFPLYSTSFEDESCLQPLSLQRFVLFSTQSFLKTIAAVSTLGFVILLDVTTIFRINFLLY